MSENTYIEEVIVRYLLEEINEEELRELEAWIEQSPENKAWFFELKRVSDAGRRALWSEAEKEASWQRMYSRLGVHAEPEGLSARSRSWHLLTWTKYAAIILVALGMGWGMHELTPPNRLFAKETPAPVFNEVKIEKGGRGNTLLLADGTRVTLNAATTFRYPTAFNADNRTVYLDGEAYFDVARDEAKPFVVRLAKQDITVLGTSFNVEAYTDETFSVVTLLSGSIALESFNDEGEAMSKMFLKPHQRAVSDNRTGSVSLENTDTSLAESWTRGKYKFKDEPLSSIARRLEKYYDVRVHIEGESLKQMKFTGSFSLEQDIQEVLRVLDYGKRYSVRQVDKEIFIVKK